MCNLRSRLFSFSGKTYYSGPCPRSSIPSESSTEGHYVGPLQQMEPAVCDTGAPRLPSEESLEGANELTSWRRLPGMPRKLNYYSMNNEGEVSFCSSASRGHGTHQLFQLVFMLVSHCGEYMANGLTNAVRHEFVMIANDRQTFVAVRKHSRSFLWCFECYAGLTSGECMGNGLTNVIRHQFAMIAK